MRRDGTKGPWSLSSYRRRPGGPWCAGHAPRRLLLNEPADPDIASSSFWFIEMINRSKRGPWSNHGRNQNSPNRCRTLDEPGGAGRAEGSGVVKVRLKCGQSGRGEREDPRRGAGMGRATAVREAGGNSGWTAARRGQKWSKVVKRGQSRSNRDQMR